MCFVGNGDELSESPCCIEGGISLFRDTAFSFPVDQGMLIQLERVKLQFQRDQVVLLLEEIKILLEYKEKLLDLDGKFLEALSRNYEALLEALGEMLVSLNASDPEYVQPGKIIE